ncbi:MAG: phosphate/phosphite/phosphonate ABC transporter substrate-binding protein [Sneathiellales bacterium]|nr:phosphate/phosphite/phosphonate ABC transporter substrate-binding protein [Sneathiellales bacterium]
MNKIASILSCVLFLGSVSGGQAATGEKLTVGVVPQQSATRLAKIWVPFLQEISKRSGQELVFATAKDIPAFEACLAQGAYDIAYMNPYHYTEFHDAVGYQAFARQKEKRLRGIIVTRQDTDLTELADLDGATVAFPSPAAFGASVVPRAEMKGQGIDITPRYVKSHDSVYRAVSAGMVPAGGGVLRTFNTVDPKIREQLKVIYRTDGYTPHAFAAHPDVPKAVVETIFSAMETLEGTAEGLLKALGMAGIEPGRNADWDDVRALGLERSHTRIVKDGEAKCL